MEINYYVYAIIQPIYRINILGTVNYDFLSNLCDISISKVFNFLFSRHICIG